MKKILLIVLNNFKNDSRVLKEALSLKKEGYSVKVAALFEKRVKEFETVNGIEVHRIKLLTKNWGKNGFVQVIKYFEFLCKTVKYYGNMDIFHCNDLNSLPVGVFIKKFFNKNAKIVYDAHEYETEVNGLSKTQKMLRRFLEKILIKYADAVITVSNAIANEYVRLYNIEKPAIVLNTPYFFTIEKKDIFREKFGIAKDKVIFLFQGKLSRGRGIELLLEVFRLICDEKSVVVFMGYGELEEVVKNYAEKYRSIFYHPAVSPDVLLEYTASADFGLSTIEDSCLSYRYCLPNKMFEYLMTDTPVIVSDLPEMKKLVEKFNVGIVVREYSVNGLKNALSEALNCDRKEFLRNIQKVKESYNWEKQEVILKKVYNGL
jgi:glycosyltransferase involved in cell wall biosynthesis